MFGVEGYTPQAILRDEQEYILPAETGGIKIASIGFFISPDDALIWRGPMATTALKQLLHQTLWEGLDYLLIDLPPGTGDVHLSVVGEVKVNGAIVVSTPQQVAVADVRRGVNMFRAEGIDVPVLGITKTWPGSLRRNSRTTGTTCSERGEHGTWPVPKASIFSEIFLSSNRLWKVVRTERRQYPSIRK